MKTPLLTALMTAAIFTSHLSAQNKGSLPRSTPEEQGVSATAISIFLDSIAGSKHEFQSFMLVRHGKVIAEGWWNPYRPDLRHTLYSLSKSFTATAVGFARAEQKLKLTDKVVSFFPDQRPGSVSPFLEQLTIEDLLTMSVGQEPDPTFATVSTDNWVKTFLALPVKYEPGSRFLYNSMATYMLSAIVQKTTGKKVLDYLQPRLFKPLGITGADWETDSHGVNTGGWGLRLRTEDIAKFAQLFLQNGKWNGKQLLPRNWAEEASSAHIIQHPNYSQEKQDSSDWEQGYGYQMWRCRHGAYRGDGAFGQYAIVFPDQDAVIAITSESMDMQGELNLIWKILLPAFQNGSLSADKNADDALKAKLAALSLPVKKESIQVDASTLKGKTFAIEPNSLNIQSMTFDVTGDKYQVALNTNTEHYSFTLAPNSWEPGETTLAGPYLLSSATNNLKGLPPFKVSGEYTWLGSNKLEIILRYTESPHTRIITCLFNGDNISVVVTRSVLPGMEGATVNLVGKMR